MIPSGVPGLRSEKSHLDVKLVWAKSLPRDMSVSGMIYYSNPFEDGRHRDVWEKTVSLGVPLGNGLGVFFEYIVDFAKEARPMHIGHSGFTYQPNTESQIDVHFGTALFGNGQSFVGVGYSVRL